MTSTTTPRTTSRPTETPDRHWLAIYLNDHLAGATGGVELCRRAARAHRDDPAGPDLSRLAREIAEDRRALIELIRRLRLPVQRHRMALGWMAEKAGRLKTNGRLVRRSPLSDLLELEGLRIGVQGKLSLWQVLRGVADRHPGLGRGGLDRLADRARAQARLLDDLRDRTARSVLR